MKISISIDLANQIIGYLGTRPYQEVFQLVAGIQEAAASNVTQLQGVEASKTAEAEKAQKAA